VILFFFYSSLMSTPSPYKKASNVTQMIVGGSRDQTVTSRDQMTTTNDQATASRDHITIREQAIASRDLMTNRDHVTASRDHTASREQVTASRDQSSLPLPDEREMDWTTLVNTATKAISVKGSDAGTGSAKQEDPEDEEIEIAHR
jgi:hypothetical protein